MTRRDPCSEPYEVTQFVEEVGTRIRLMRAARGITQSDLAARADISRPTLSAIEAGALSSRFADIARLLWALDDVSLQTALASAAQDPAYQEAARAHIPLATRRQRTANWLGLLHGYAKAHELCAARSAILAPPDKGLSTAKGHPKYGVGPGMNRAGEKPQPPQRR